MATRTSAGDSGWLAAGTVVAGRYHILAVLGVGGMGVVYKARDERLAVDIALKILRPDIAAQTRLRERFRQELLLARQVTHRNVVRIHDLGEDGDLLFLTMDLVAGRSLREILEKEGPLPAGRAVAVAGQLAEALAAAHAEGVVHRDLKPENVLVDGSGRAYITDFGVARSLLAAGLTHGLPAAALTWAGAVVGTPDYLSPEQARGEPVDGRSDLYALGIVLFEMLSGKLPFAGGTFAELLAQRISGTARDLRQAGVEVPARLRAIVRRCLERQPSRRYQSAGELASDLAGSIAGSRSAPGSWQPAWHPGSASLGGSAPAPPRAWLGGLRRPAREWATPRVWLAAGTALLVLALAGFAWWLARSRLTRGARPAAVASAGAGLPGGGAPEASRPRHVVAVLPLADETGRSELGWSSAGMAEMLAASLAESPALRVVDSLRLLRAVQDLKLPPGHLSVGELRQLADLVEADRLVTGAVRASAGRVRVDLSLVASDLPALPARALHAEGAAAADVFRLVGELGAQLRKQLEVAPGVESSPVLTSSPAAMAAYTQGTARLLRADSLGAAPLLERAVGADPSFTAAWVRLAGCYQSLGYSEKAQAAAARAVGLLGAARSRIAYEARAREALLAGKPETAQEILRQLVTSYPNDLEARLALAEAYGEQGNLQAAVDGLRQVVKLDPNHPRAWFLLGKYIVKQGEPRRAIDDPLVHALVVQNRLGSEQGKADVLNAIGVAYQELGDLDRSAENYRMAAATRLRIGDRRGYAMSLKNLATLALIRGDHGAAERNLDQALSILQGIGDKSGIAELYNTFGMLDEERGRYDRALDAYRRGLQLRRDLGDRFTLAQSLDNVGFTYHLLGDYDNAMVYWQQALALHHAGGNRRGVLMTTQSIGQLQLAQGKWAAALKSFLDTLGESRELRIKETSAVAHGFLGRVAQYQGRYQAALASYGEALALVRELGDRRGETEFTLYAAEALAEIGMREAAAERLAQAAKWLEAAGQDRDDEHLAQLASLRGENALRRGDAAAARASFQQAARRAEASHSITARLQARLGGALAASAAGRPGALAELRAVDEELQRLGHAPLLLRAVEELAAVELARGQAAAAASAARRGLGLAGQCGSYAGAYRLHLLLAKALRARGAAAEAAEERQRGAQEVARLRANLAPDQRKAFDALPEVRELGEQAQTAVRPAAA
jgi:tetratricopeptide (TPR) repeat protein